MRFTIEWCNRGPQVRFVWTTYVKVSRVVNAIYIPSDPVLASSEMVQMDKQLTSVDVVTVEWNQACPTKIYLPSTMVLISRWYLKYSQHRAIFSSSRMWSDTFSSGHTGLMGKMFAHWMLLVGLHQWLYTGLVLRCLPTGHTNLQDKLNSFSAITAPAHMLHS